MEVPQISLHFKVENIREINSFTSTKFQVRGLEWQIKVRISKQGLAVHLESLKVDKSTDWSCMARCKIQLISLYRQPYERSFKSPREFSAKQLTHGFQKFISLKEMFDPTNSFIENNSISLKIKVEASKPIILSESLVDKTTCIRLKINNMNDSCGFLSPVVDIQGVPWRIKVYTTKIDRTKHVSVMLNCAYNESTDWSCKARAVFRLKSFDPARSPFEWKFKKLHNFTTKSKSHGCKTFITWKDLLNKKKQFLQNDSILFDIEMIVEKPVGIGHRKTTECPICMENLLGLPVSATKCGHVFCRPCIERAIRNSHSCPTCSLTLCPSQIQMIFLP